MSHHLNAGPGSCIILNVANPVDISYQQIYKCISAQRTY